METLKMTDEELASARASLDKSEEWMAILSRVPKRYRGPSNKNWTYSEWIANR